MIFLEGFRTCLIANRPAVNIRKEFFDLGHTFFKIPDFRDHKKVNQIFFIIRMWNFFQKIRRKCRIFRDFFCNITQDRSAHANHFFHRKSRNQLNLKIPVFQILQSKQLFNDFFHEKPPAKRRITFFTLLRRLLRF